MHPRGAQTLYAALPDATGKSTGKYKNSCEGQMSPKSNHF